MRNARLVRLVSALALVAGAFAVAPAAASAGAPSGDPSLRPTATHGILLRSGPRSAIPYLLPASLPVTVGLRLRNQTALEVDIADRRRVSPEQFELQFAPTQATARSVLAYLRSQGYRDATVSPDHMLVRALGTPATAEAAFHTRIDTGTFHGRPVFANATTAYVPAGLAGAVTGILGLNDLPDVHAAPPPNQRCQYTGGTTGCFHTPQALQLAYDEGSLPSATKTPIAIFTAGDLATVLNDVSTERSDDGLPAVPVTVEYENASAQETTAQLDTEEWDLDAEYSSGLAGQVAQLYLYDAATLSSADILQSLDQWTTPAAGSSSLLSYAADASFGFCEDVAASGGIVAAYDPVLMKAAAEGQTLFASSGDDGSLCNEGTTASPNQQTDVNYPAASPYVVAVGGTTLTTNTDGTYGGETAWSGSGGGVSTDEPAPSWQKTDGYNGSAVTSTCGTNTSTCGRTVPDVANDADPNTGVVIVWTNGSGTQEQVAIGGTSLSSPMTLGEWARLETANNNGLGFAAPILYSLRGTAAFDDVTSGSNGSYSAGPGYDLVTGLGTLDVANAGRFISPSPSTPEAPWAAALPVAGALLCAGTVLARRRRAVTRSN